MYTYLNTVLNRIKMYWLLWDKAIKWPLLTCQTFSHVWALHQGLTCLQTSRISGQPATAFTRKSRDPSLKCIHFLWWTHVHDCVQV